MFKRRFRISGRVQGVGFRVYVQQLATDAGLVGEVWNCLNGDVELVACHDQELVLYGLAAALWQGPGNVESVTWVPEESSEQYERFRIGPTR